jgi:hypothetical protein
MDVGENDKIYVHSSFRILFETAAGMRILALAQLLERGNTTQDGYNFLPKAVAELQRSYVQMVQKRAFLTWYGRC